MAGCPQPGEGILDAVELATAPTTVRAACSGTDANVASLIGLAVGIALGLVLNVSVSPDLARYSAVAILAGLDSVLGAVRAELDAHYDNRVFLSGFITNALVAVGLTFVGDRLGIDLYLVALFAFGAHLPKRRPHPAPLPVGSGAGRTGSASARDHRVAWTGRRCWSASMPAQRR